MSGFIVRGGPAPEVADLAVRTFADGEVRFASKGRRTRVTELVIHETVTRSVESTLSVLRKCGLSVHLVLGPDGQFTQHGDLTSDVLWRAGPVHNEPSFGVEVVNPYYPRLLRKGLPWERTIKAPWAHEGQYVLPTPAQAEAVAALVRWATSAPAPGIEVPRRWPGLRAGSFQFGPVAEAQKPLPGVLAHHYFGHADGAWLVLYAWLRIEAGLTPDVAFEEAVKRTTGVCRADVRDLLPTPAAA
ncbi:N-acetylmuramoyl-L-alanine amidase [Corallococcus sp. EGB]|uniref:peptidoglycan recognition protein family protein n=1 Tax=Corallococcus sp. EGB TaxID=1521117 RepID=UPI001CBF20AE|nr:N-acetylmuramoyl-L-alanine amidase [Corallococcus sp. EGB]